LMAEDREYILGTINNEFVKSVIQSDSLDRPSFERNRWQ
jgi:hypothetical protein